MQRNMVCAAVTRFALLQHGVRCCNTDLHFVQRLDKLPDDLGWDPRTHARAKGVFQPARQSTPRLAKWERAAAWWE